MYEHIQQWLGLHQEVAIWYCVDHFRATIFEDDACTQEMDMGEGSTVEEALANLEKNLKEHYGSKAVRN